MTFCMACYIVGHEFYNLEHKEDTTNNWNRVPLTSNLHNIPILAITMYTGSCIANAI